MTFAKFCLNFYNGGKYSCLHAIRSKPDIAMFFLKNALSVDNLAFIPLDDSARKWFADRASRPKDSLWDRVLADCKINEKKLLSALGNALTDDRDLLLGAMDNFQFPLTDEERKDPNKAARSRFVRVLVEQFYNIAKGKGKAPDIVSIKELPEPTQFSIEELSSYYTPYWTAVSNRLSKVKTVIHDESLSFQEIYANPSLTDRLLLDDMDMPFPDYTPIIPEPDLKTIREYSIHTVVQATGGMGKSMLMRHLMFNGIETFQCSGKIVVFAWLMDYDHSNYEISDFLFDEIHSYYENYDREAFNRELNNNSFIILFDGLDEIKTTYRSQFLSRLHKFSSVHSEMQIIMTSRPFESDLELGDYSELTICPLSIEKAKEVVHKISFTDESIKEDFISALDNSLFIEYRIFAINPLLLNFMLLTFRERGRIPKQKAKFYEEVYFVLAYRHDKFKTNFKRTLRSGLTPERFREIFSAFCANSYMAEMRSFSYVELYNYFQEIISGLPKEEERSLNPDSLIYDAMSGVCMLYREGENYYFVHNSFQEYFTAVSLERQNNDDLKDCLEELYIDGHFRPGDMSLPFMYEIMRDRIVELLLYPYLKDVFRACNQSMNELGVVDLYLAFLFCLNVDLNYTIGYVNDSFSYSFDPPPVMLFILETVGRVGDLDDNRPILYYKDFVVHYQYTVVDDTGAFHVLDFEEGQEGFDPPDESMIEDWSIIDSYAFDMRVAVSRLLFSKNKEKYIQIINYIESEDCFLKRQFLAVEKFFHSLQQEISGNSHKSKLHVKRV